MIDALNIETRAPRADRPDGSSATTWQMDRIFAALDEGFCICEMIPDSAGRPADYRFLEVNSKFEEFTGVKDAVGRTARELVPDLDLSRVEAYGRVGLSRETLRFEHHVTSTGRWFDVFATPVEPFGRFAVIFRETTATRRVEQEREAALDRASQLLEELNHRVMNSLGMIAAIISVESGALESAEGKAALQRVRARIEALGSLYRLLTNSSAVEAVDARSYLSAVISGVAGSLSGERDIHVETRIEPLTLDLKRAVPLALITNELVTNSLKYAFEGVDTPRIDVSFTFCEEAAVLSVSDNGIGFSDDGPRNGSGVGNRLIDAFARQLSGTLTRRSDDTGTTVVLDFPLSNAAEAPAA